MIIRPERPADVAVVEEVARAAFGGEKVPRLLVGLRSSVAWLDLSFVAEDGSGGDEGEVVGHLSYTRAWVDAPDRVVDVLVLSPLSVRPDKQGQGVGRALVEESLSMLQDRDEPAVFLEGDPRYYVRLGFEAAGPWGFTAPSVRIPPRAFQAVRLPSYDAAVAEGFAGALVYPDVFWRYDSVGLRS